MTITLSGRIQCLDGRFEVSKQDSLKDGYRPNVDDRLVMLSGLTVRVTRVTWTSVMGAAFASYVPNLITISDCGLKRMRAEVEAIFVENGFCVSEVEPS